MSKGSLSWARLGCRPVSAARQPWHNFSIPVQSRCRESSPERCTSSRPGSGPVPSRCAGPGPDFYPAYGPGTPKTRNKKISTKKIRP